MRLFVAAALLCVLLVATEAGAAKNQESRRKRIDSDSVSDSDSEETEWPKPQAISNFPVPDSFAKAPGETVGDDGPDETSPPSAGRHRPQRFRRH
ncbi:unnamed protein product [Leptosia nina]|uniref:Uncharacterized protein n=1 Tax=Leptosia nina TaxID=320188 RepID=A0AAV1K3Y4_9NEOP